MSRYVVCYDISDDRLRRRVAGYLDGFGDRVQNSVFELPIDGALLDRCMNLIAREIAQEEDRIAVYRLCGKCERERVYFGRLDGCDTIGEEDVFIVRSEFVTSGSHRNAGRL